MDKKLGFASLRAAGLCMLASIGLSACLTDKNDNGELSALEDDAVSLVDNELANQALAIFESRCASCHDESSAGFGGLNFITDYDALLNSGLVQPFDENSAMCIRMSDMPPVDPKDAEKLIVCQWIAAGAPDWTFVPVEEVEEEPEAEITSLTDNDIIDLIKTDIESVDPADRQFMRYLSFHNLYNNGTSASTISTRARALNKLINSMSWNPAISLASSIDANKIIWRIDLRKYNWTAANWKSFTDQLSFSSFNGDSQARQSYLDTASATGAEIPYALADRFMHNASQPVLYHEFTQMPNTALALESQLGINRVSNIDNNNVIRAGFLISNVSFSNRIVERHSTSLGYYWISYDFENNNGTNDIYSFPLGGTNDPDYPNTFTHAGGEVIFSLPNGFQAYMLIDTAGDRIDSAPTDIVSDPLRPDNAVHNGVSCISCHSAGMNRAVDNIRSYANANSSSFSNSELSKILDLYPAQSIITSTYDGDVSRFTQALDQVAISTSEPEPFIVAVLKFEGDLNLKEAAADLNISEELLLDSINSQADIATAIGALANDEKVSRTAFDTIAPAILDHLDINSPK